MAVHRYRSELFVKVIRKGGGCIEHGISAYGPFKCYVTQWVGGGVGGWLSAFPEKSITKVYGSTLALRGGGWGQISREKAFGNT